MEFNLYTILIILCLLVVLSYLFNAISRRTKIPSVLMLLATGIGLKYTAIYLDYNLPKTQDFLGILGVIGLILIVLEGALDLKVNREILPIIRKSLGSAFLILLISSFLIALIIQTRNAASLKSSLVNAIPLAVISSAIAIPSISNIRGTQREFIIYETIFSDILGIMLFNYVVQTEVLSASSLFLSLLDLILILVISTVCSFLLLFFAGRTTTHIKFFLIIAVLVLIYSIGKLFHLSSLLLILVFGLLVNNTELFIKGRLLNILRFEKLKPELRDFRLITIESAFLIRTFFFVLFGFSIDPAIIMDIEVIIAGCLVLAVLFIVRLLYLKYIARTNLIPELFIAPRGLVTVLLFYSIPKKYAIESLGEGVLFFIIIITSIIMMLGLIATKSKDVSQID
jgi:Kef-type K+ transport system membrane component KefB